MSVCRNLGKLQLHNTTVEALRATGDEKNAALLELIAAKRAGLLHKSESQVDKKMCYFGKTFCLYMMFKETHLSLLIDWN